MSSPRRIALDEFIYHTTHDRTVDWLMPGVPPTGSKLSIPMMAVVNVRGDRLYNGNRVIPALR
jgi:carboxymethylenebutenolidase